MLRQSARSLLEKECPSTLVRKLMAEERGYLPDQWKKLAELGWTGLVISPEFGGSGLTYVDLVVVLEEMGRVVLPSPFIPTLLFTEAIRRSGTDDQKKHFLPAICRGDLIGTLAYMEPHGIWDPAAVSMRAEKTGAGFVLDGVKLFVPDGHIADWMTVAARTSDSGENGITMF